MVWSSDRGLGDCGPAERDLHGKAALLHGRPLEAVGHSPGGFKMDTTDVNSFNHELWSPAKHAPLKECSPAKDTFTKILL